MRYLRLTDFQEQIGNTINIHYAGLEVVRFVGSFFLEEVGVQVCYIKYDDDNREIFPEGVEVISEETFNERNDEYYALIHTERIDYEEKVITLESELALLQEEFTNYRIEQDMLIMQLLLAGGVPQV